MKWGGGKQNEKNKKSEDLEKEEKSIMQNYKKNKETLTIKEIEALSDKLIEYHPGWSSFRTKWYHLDTGSLVVAATRSKA